MKIVKMYEASDGKRFKTFMECCNYESTLATEDKLVELSNYDLKQDAVILKDVEDIKNFLKEGKDWIEKLSEDIWYDY